ncbi:MAG: twin-arginine translocase TatA/TatE family subunit [Rubrobacter sp.]|nr:twin-arginine translocase TatA/TatE family subunit [Rubrobacter sp.]
MYSGLLSPSHLIIVLLIIMLLFGAKRLPELGRNLGQGIKEFKEGLATKEEPKEEKRTVAVEGVQENASRVKTTQEQEEEHQRP